MSVGYKETIIINIRGVGWKGRCRLVCLGVGRDGVVEVITIPNLILLEAVTKHALIWCL